MMFEQRLHRRSAIIYLPVSKFLRLVLVELVFNSTISMYKLVHVKFSIGVVVQVIKIVFIREKNANEHVRFIDDDYREIMLNNVG